MCYWKQWGYVRSKVRNLLRLEACKKSHIGALSRGLWHLARTLAVQSGISTIQRVVGRAGADTCQGD